MDVASLDDSVVRAAQAGDAAAFETLTSAVWCDLVRFARSVVGEGDAEDVVQESLVAGWRDLRGLRDPSRFRSWILSVVFRRALRWKRWRRVLLPLAAAPVRWHATDPSASLDVAAVLRRLTPRQRAVMHLTVVEGFTDAEIGEALHTTPATVRAQRRRARERIAAAMKVKADAREG